MKSNIKRIEEMSWHNGYKRMECTISTGGWPPIKLVGFYHKGVLEAWGAFDISDPEGEFGIRYTFNEPKEQQCERWLAEAKAKCS